MNDVDTTGSPESPESWDAEPSPRPEGPGTVRGMSKTKAGVISGIVGLAIAGGVFAGFGLPGSLKAAKSQSKYAINAAIDEEIHVGLGPFRSSGPREIEILSIELLDPSPAIHLDEIRIQRANQTGAVPLGSDKGPREDIAALPTAAGVVLQPGDDGGFWVSFRVTATGSHTFNGLRISYRSGWLTRSTVIGPGVRMRVAEPRGPRGGGGGRTPRSASRTR